MGFEVNLLESSLFLTNTKPCARYVRLSKIDDEVWRKTWELISTPGELARRIGERVAELQAEHAYAAGDVDRLTKELDDLFAQRQWVITPARTGKITQEDMETQLAALDWQKASAQAELSKAQMATGDVAARLVEIGEDYRRDVLAGADAITREPETPEQAGRIFEARRRIVARLVQKASVKADKSVDVEVLVDLSEAMAQPMENVSISSLLTGSQVTDQHAYITLTL